MCVRIKNCTFYRRSLYQHCFLTWSSFVGFMIAAARFVPPIVYSGTAQTDTVIFLFQGPPNSSIWWWNWNWRKWRYAERWSKSASVSRQGCLPGLNHFKCCKHTIYSACFCCCCCCLILYLFFRVPKSLHFLNLSQLKPNPLPLLAHTHGIRWCICWKICLLENYCAISSTNQDQSQEQSWLVYALFPRAWHPLSVFESKLITIKNSKKL